MISLRTDTGRQHALSPGSGGGKGPGLLLGLLVQTIRAQMLPHGLKVCGINERGHVVCAVDDNHVECGHDITPEPPAGTTGLVCVKRAPIRGRTFRLLPSRSSAKAVVPIADR